MASDPNRHDRRESDALAARISELSERLERHVTDCTAQSRKLFWAVLGVLGWLITQSPFIGKIFSGGP